MLLGLNLTILTHLSDRLIATTSGARPKKGNAPPPLAAGTNGFILYGLSFVVPHLVEV